MMFNKREQKPDEITMNDSYNSAENSTSRRDFLRSAAFFGGMGILATGVVSTILKFARDQKSREFSLGTYDYSLNNPDNIIYSSYLGRGLVSPIKAKLNGGVLVKVDGNPYSPESKFPNLAENESIEKAASVEGFTNPDSQDSVIEQLYNPARLRKVLKRKPGTNRGDAQWETIDFNQAIREIVDGGNLFGTGNIDGLKNLYSLKDPSLAKSLSDDIENLRNGKISLDEFTAKHRNILNSLIDQKHPDLGPKNNQFVFLSGGLPGGRKQFSERFVKSSFGSVNLFSDSEAGTASRRTACRLASDVSDFRADYKSADFVIFFGPGFSGLDTTPAVVSSMVAENSFKRGAKYFVVDSKLPDASGVSRWIPINPGTETAFAMGMMKWILENNSFDSSFLSNANINAAISDNESSYSSASWLVKIENGIPTAYLKASEIGVGKDNQYVVMRNGRALAVDINGESVEGDLVAHFNSHGISAKSAFALFSERINEKSIEEYASVCGVSPAFITDAAREFVSHGKKSAADFHFALSAHSNGVKNSLSIILLNALVGNIGADGGIHSLNNNANFMSGVFDLENSHPAKFAAFGIPVSREGVEYEKSTIFADYPARRPWFSLAENITHEVIPSIADSYPYSAKILFLHNVTSATFSNSVNLSLLKDEKSFPLIVACDTQISELTTAADYIFPDTTLWESWAFFENSSSISQPVVSPLTEIIEIDGTRMHCNLEAVLIALGKYLELPGYIGKNEINHQDDFYLKAAANLASASRADGSEHQVFINARKHLSNEIFNESRWINSCGNQNWDRVVFMLNRGGKFDTSERPNNFNLVRFFADEISKTRNSLTGGIFDPLPSVEKDHSKSNGLFNLVARREVSYEPYTPVDSWDKTSSSGDTIFIAKSDADRLGIRDGSILEIETPSALDNAKSAKISGRVKVIQGIKPGTVSVASRTTFSHSSTDVLWVDGSKIQTQRDSRPGIKPATLLLANNAVKNSPLSDLLGGSISVSEISGMITSV